MAASVLITYPGKDLIIAHKGKNLGFFTEKKIDADIADNPNGNESTTALRLIQQFITSCSIDVATLSTESCNDLAEAIKWLAIYRYLKYDLEHIKKKEECCGDDYRKLNHACARVKDYLCQINPCLVEKFEDHLKGYQKKENKAMYDPTLFQGSLIDQCGCETIIGEEIKSC